jgi:hypothetical protein
LSGLLGPAAESGWVGIAQPATARTAAAASAHGGKRRRERARLGATNGFDMAPNLHLNLAKA